MNDNDSLSDPQDQDPGIENTDSQPDPVVKEGEADPGESSEISPGQPEGSEATQENEPEEEFPAKVTDSLDASMSDSPDRNSHESVYEQAEQSGSQDIDELQIGDRHYYLGGKRIFDEKPEDKSTESGRINESELPALESDLVDELHRTLVQDRMLIIAHDSSTVEASRDMLVALRYAVQSHSDTRSLNIDQKRFDFAVYETHPELFQYSKSTVTAVFCHENRRVVTPLLTRETAGRLSRALEKSNNHLMVVVEGNIEKLRQQQVRRPSKIKIWQPDPPHSFPAKIDIPVSWKTDSPMAEVIRMLAVFFPGLNHQEFFYVADLLIRKLIANGNDETGEELQSELALWSSAPDRFIADAGVCARVDGDAQMRGYFMENKELVSQVERAFFEKSPLFLNNCFKILTDLYFSSDKKREMYSDLYPVFLTKLQRAKIISIDIDWLLTRFERSRLLRCGDPGQMKYLLKILLEFGNYPDGARLAEEFLLFLIRHLRAQELEWARYLLKDDALIKLALESNRLPSVRDSIKDFKDSPTAKFLELRDSYFATNFLLVYGFSGWSKFVFRAYFNLIKGRHSKSQEQSRLLSLDLKRVWVFPVAESATDSLGHHAYYNFDNFFDLTEGLVSASRAQSDSQSKAEVKQHNATILDMWNTQNWVLLRHSRGAVRGRERSIDFMNELLEPELRQEKASFVADSFYVRRALLEARTNREYADAEFVEQSAEFYYSIALIIVLYVENESLWSDVLHPFVNALITTSDGVRRKLQVGVKRRIKSIATEKKRDYQSSRRRVDADDVSASLSRYKAGALLKEQLPRKSRERV